MSRMLFYGDSPTATTGFGNINRLLISEWKKIDPNLEIVVLGISHMGGYYDRTEIPAEVYPALYEDRFDGMGVKRLLKILKHEDPEIHGSFDVFFANIDYYTLHTITIEGRHIWEYMQEYMDQFSQSVIYSPVDHPQQNDIWMNVYKLFKHVVFTSNFSKQAIYQYSPEIAKGAKVVYNGIETNLFKPMKKEYKEELKRRFGCEGKFVIGYVGRNQYRKDFYHLIKIFKKFHERHKDSFLYLHTKPVENVLGSYNIPEMLRNELLFLKDDYMLPFNLSENKGIKRTDMNDIYNLMDVFLSTSLGEGFGIPFIEAMCAGTVVVAHNNTTTPELVGTDRGFKFGSKSDVCFGEEDNHRIRQLPDVDEAVKVLDKVYEQYDTIGVVRNKARDFAEGVTYQKMAKELWEVINEK